MAKKEASSKKVNKEEDISKEKTVEENKEDTTGAKEEVNGEQAKDAEASISEGSKKKDKKDKDKAGKKGKSSKGGSSTSEDEKGKGGNARNVDVMDRAAMENANNICHSVQDLLYFRGFYWDGQNKKGKGKARKKGKK